MTFRSTTTLDALSGVLGEFWLPNDTTKIVPGILTIESESNTSELYLNGSLSELSLSLSDNDVKTIHGHIGRIPVTLSRCLRLHKELPFGPEKYLVQLIVSGAHITNESEKVIERVYLRLDNMHSWIPPTPIEHSLQSKGEKGWKLDLSATSEPVIERSSTHFGSIEVYRSNGFHSEQHKFDITSESTIIFKYPRGASIQDVIEHCGCIRNLSAMVTSTLCNITLLELVVCLPDAQKSHEINLYLNWVEDRIIKKPSEFEVITYTELGGIDAMAKCLNDYHESRHNAAVLNRLGRFWLSSAPYNEHKFISMTVALEHLFLWLNNIEKLKKKDKELGNQLNNIIRPITSGISLFVPDKRWLSKKAVRYRGWAAHANLDVPPEGLLPSLMFSLYLCIMLRYAYGLGANIKELCDKIYSGHRQFRRWDYVLKEAMEKHPVEK